MTMAMDGMSNVSAADKDFIGKTEGFFERYVRNLAYYDRCEEAYERTEAQYFALMGKLKYTSYGSFRAAYSRFYKKR
jgi:hypothetical protein